MFDVSVPAAGRYTLAIRYASQDFGGAPRSLDLSLNGGAAISTVFPSTDTASQPGFNNWEVLELELDLLAGDNSLSLAIPPGASAGPNIDAIDLYAPGGSPDPDDMSADEDANLFLSGPDGALEGAALASINFNIAGRDPDVVLTEISFDGALAFVPVFPDADGDFTVDGSALSAGAMWLPCVSRMARAIPR